MTTDLYEQLKDDLGYLQLDRAAERLTRARQALAKHQSIKSCQSAVRKKTGEAGLHVAGLVDEVDQAIRDLIAAINL
jgi:hypothetical protein